MKLLTVAAGLLLALAACGGVPETPGELEKAVGKSLGRHTEPDVQVLADPSGEYLVVAEYRPLLRSLSAVKDEMLDAYGIIFAADVPVAGASITAYGTMVDGFGRDVKGVDKVYHCGGEKLSHWYDDKGVQGE